MSEIKPQKVKVELVQATDQGGITFIGTSVDTQEVVVISIQSKKYNPDTRQREADEEMYNAAIAHLQELGATSLETAETELNVLALNGDLILPEVYVNGEISSFKPIQSGFETFEKKISNPDAKAFEGQEVVSGKFSHFPGFRYNLGIDVEDREGETKHVRVAQIILDNDDEDTFSLKYITPRIQDLRNNIRDGKIAEERVESMQNIIDKLTAVEHDKKVKALSELFGRDFEKAVEAGVRVKGKVKMAAVGSGREKNNFVTLLVDPDDFIVEADSTDEA